MWSIETFNDLATKENGSFVDGPFGSNLKTSDYVEKGVPIIRIQNVRPNQFLPKDIKYISLKKAKELHRHNYKPGDLVITKLGAPCGVACIVPESAGEGIIVADVVRFRGDRKKIDHQFLSYFINSYEGKKQIAKQAKGTTRKRVNLSNFKKLKIPLPPLPVQKRIAAILVMADALREKRRQAIAKLDELLKAVFLDMFGDPIKNPKRWPKDKMSNILKIRRGGSPRPINNFLGGDYNWIKIGDATKGDNIYLNSCKEKIIADGLKKTVYLKAGNLIFANCGVSLGFARILNIDGCIHDGWLSFEEIPEDKLDKIFLLKALNSITLYFRKIAPDGTQPNLNTNIMKNFSIILPPIEQQKRFRDLVLSIEKQRILSEKSIKKYEMIFSSLQQRAFKGEL